jgi:hypothetical protein
MLVELLFVPDKVDSKALRYALLRYCGGCMHLIFAPARPGAMLSCREFKIMDAQAIFYAFGDPEGKNGPAWRGLVSKNGSTIYARI